jgi:phospholipase/lecithinase/hemolysin
LRKLSAIIAALLAPALAAAPAQAGSFSALYSFGDSLSDVGNVFAATGGARPAPPYVNGQFSNGPVWVQDLSKIATLGVLAPSILGGNDYAWGGATTGANGPSLAPPDVNTQVGQFLAAHGNSAPSNGLYTVWIGANDLFSGVTPMAAAQSEANAIKALVQAGANTLIVPLVPDLGETPAGSGVAGASSLASTYNALLESDLTGVAGVHFLDTFQLIDQAVVNPGAFGLTDVTDACYTGTYFGYAGVPSGTVCATPNTYLFWDQLHPTAAVDAIIAADAWALVPSPRPGAGLFSLGLLLLIGLKSKRA